MSTTAPIEPWPPEHAATPWGDTRPNPPVSVSERPAFGEMLGEIVPLIGVVVVAGPPVVFLVGPLVLLALLLAGPFALLLTLVVAMLGAALLLAAIAVTPYLLIRRVHRHRIAHAAVGDSASQLNPVESPRAAA